VRLQIPWTGPIRRAEGPVPGSRAGSPGRAAGDGRAIGELSDADIVMALARGQAAALAEAYRRHGLSVYGVITRLCGPGQAEEMTGEVFLSLWHSPGKFGPGTGSLRPLLMAEAHRKAVEFLRADTTRRAREAAMPAEDLEQEVLANAANDAIRSLLAEFPRTERQAIILTYFGGYTRRQVASMVRRPAETVNTDLCNGISRLRAKLTPAMPASRETRAFET
jgi:RNA polymerase sigma factor (sigma-70 family)